MLIEHGVPLRPDWEAVIRPVVDFALARPDVDPARVASRAGASAATSRRAARPASTASPPASPTPACPGRRTSCGTGSSPTGSPPIRPTTSTPCPTTSCRRSSPGCPHNHDGRWRMEQRGPFVHGVATSVEALRTLADYSMEGHYDQVTCPTLLTAAENDPLSALAADFASAWAIVATSCTSPRPRVRATTANSQPPARQPAHARLARRRAAAGLIPGRAAPSGGQPRWEGSRAGRGPARRGCCASRSRCRP